MTTRAHLSLVARACVMGGVSILIAFPVSARVPARKAPAVSVGLDARLTNALEQGRCDVAAAIADTLIGGLRARHAPRSLALAAGIDSLALRLASSDGIDCYRHALDLLGEV